MFAAIWFMAGIAINMFLLTKFITNSSSQVYIKKVLNSKHILVLAYLLFLFQLFLSGVGFGLGACIFACIAIFGIVASESFPVHLSGTAHAIAALTGNGKLVMNIYI